MTVTELTYLDDDCEVLVHGQRATVFDRWKGRYYQTDIDRLPPSLMAATSPRVPRVPSFLGFAAPLGMLALLVLNYAAMAAQPAGTPSILAAVIVSIYLPVSIALHEFAHVLALRAVGRHIDGVGFKLNLHVFPAFYVRMNQSLLLVRSEKVVVHSAGIVSNLAINAAVLIVNASVIGSPDVTAGAYLVLVALAMNVVPFLNSDGYRVLLAIADVDVVRGLRRNAWWVVAIKFVSIAYAVWSVTSFAWTVVAGVHGA